MKIVRYHTTSSDSRAARCPVVERTRRNVLKQRMRRYAQDPVQGQTQRRNFIDKDLQRALFLVYCKQKLGTPRVPPYQRKSCQLFSQTKNLLVRSRFLHPAETGLKILRHV